MVELLCTPCAVYTAEAPALQFDSQLAVGGQHIFGVAHFVMEEADGCQIRLYSGSRFPMLLQIQHIANKVLAADVAQFLKVVLVSQVGTEPLARLVVAILGAETALTIMAGQFAQLTHQGQIEALVLNGSCHMVKCSFSFISSSDGRSSPLGRAVCFRRISRKIFVEPGGQSLRNPLQQRRFQEASHERRISVSFSVGTRSVRVQYGDRPCHRWALQR